MTNELNYDTINKSFFGSIPAEMPLTKPERVTRRLVMEIKGIAKQLLNRSQELDRKKKEIKDLINLVLGCLYEGYVLNSRRVINNPVVYFSVNSPEGTLYWSIELVDNPKSMGRCDRGMLIVKATTRESGHLGSLVVRERYFHSLSPNNVDVDLIHASLNGFVMEMIRNYSGLQERLTVFLGEPR